MILEDFSFETPKTKDFANVLRSLSISDKKTLFVVSKEEKNVVISARNLQNTKVITADTLSTYDVLNADSLLISESSVEKIENLLK